MEVDVAAGGDPAAAAAGIDDVIGVEQRGVLHVDVRTAARRPVPLLPPLETGAAADRDGAAGERIERDRAAVAPLALASRRFRPRLVAPTERLPPARTETAAPPGWPVASAAEGHRRSARHRRAAAGVHRRATVPAAIERAAEQWRRAGDGRCRRRRRLTFPARPSRRATAATAPTCRGRSLPPWQTTMPPGALLGVAPTARRLPGESGWWRVTLRDVAIDAGDVTEPPAASAAGPRAPAVAGAPRVRGRDAPPVASRAPMEKVPIATCGRSRS